ncbi:MAG TPA: phytanoyl-CoA dioxygenase family protein, partial [Candidatus Xenobia bacterium]
MTAPSWADLESKGYVVVRSWASPDEVTRLREDFEAQPLDGNKNYTLKLLGPGIIEWLTGKLHDTASQVRSHTDIRADMLAFPPPVYFAIDLGTNFPWHQDHESFFLLQEHYHYLNFYLAVVKPRPDKSNLAVIPFDRLQKLSPTFHDRVKGGGASHIMNWIEGQPALFVDDQTGQTTVLSFDPEQAAAIPELEAGDLLIIRGDMFHRTQDVETHRISASFRMADSH